MPLKKYLLAITICTIFCWLAWIVVLYFIDPKAAGFIGLFCFYISLFIALIGTFSLLGFFLRVWFSKEEIIYRYVGVSLRQAVFFAILVVGSLLLLGMRLFTWWNGLFLVLGLTILEFFFLTKDSQHQIRS